MSRLPVMDTALWLNAGTARRYPRTRYPAPRLMYEAVCRNEGGAACEAWAGTLFVQKIAPDARTAIAAATAAAPRQWPATWPHMAKLVAGLEAAAAGKGPIPDKKSLEAAVTLALAHPLYASRTAAALSRLGLAPGSTPPVQTAPGPASRVASAAAGAAAGAVSVIQSLMAPIPPASLVSPGHAGGGGDPSPSPPLPLIMLGMGLLLIAFRRKGGRR